MEYIGRELNKYGNDYVHQYWCANGHNNRYAYKSGAPPPKYTVGREEFVNKDEAYSYCCQLARGGNKRPRVKDCINKRYIRYEELNS